MNDQDLELEKRLRRNDDHVTMLMGLLRDTSGLSGIPVMVSMIIDEGAWKERRISDTGQVVTFDNFAKFVQTAPLAGLGADLQTLYEICYGTEAQGKIEGVTPAVKPNGRPDQNFDISKFSGSNQGGTSRLYIIARLKRDIELADTRGNKAEAERLQTVLGQVIAKEKPAIKAAQEVGYRPHTSQIYPNDVTRTAKILRKVMSSDELADLINLLMKDDEE